MPEHLQSQYPQFMREIAANDLTGRTLEQNPELSGRIDRFRADITENLPDRFNAPPEPKLGRTAKLKKLAGKGLGALGTAGGGLQASQGVQDLRGGTYVEGAGNITSAPRTSSPEAP